MILNEMFDTPPEEFQDIEDDNSTVEFDDLRKSRLTLMQINKLRRMQDVRAYEQQQKVDRIKKQYSQSSAEPSSAMEL